MRLSIALRCQIPLWPGLLPLLAASLCHPPTLSSVSPYSLRRAPRVGRVDRAFSLECYLGGIRCFLGHAEASRHEVAPQALALNRKPRESLLKEYLQQLLHCRSVDELRCVRASAGVWSKILGAQVVPHLIAAVSPDQHRVTPGHVAQPASQARNLLNLKANPWPILTLN